jgi:hypothetical protein
LADGNASQDLMPSKKGKRLKVSTTKSPNKTQSTSRHQSSGSVNMTDKEIEEELQTKDKRISSKSKTVNVDNYSCHDKEQLSGNGLSIC